jgi:thymidine kinase
MTCRAGRLEVICGCMFSGKTTELIRRLEQARAHGAAVIALKPVRDTRYASDRIVSHDGPTFDATPVHDEPAILSAASGFDVVGIDEIHFFDEAVADACRQLVAGGARVIAAGVDIDHRGRPFPAVRRLLELADETIRRTARCARCGAVAEFSQRLVDSDDPIVVGGADLYEPRCRRCFRPPP